MYSVNSEVEFHNEQLFLKNKKHVIQVCLMIFMPNFKKNLILKRKH